MDFETQVKLSLYETIAETARVPTLQQLTERLGRPRAELDSALLGLAQKRLVVLDPEEPGRIRMAPPFSGVETDFVARVGDKSYFANCVWDVFGVAAALGRDARIEARDGHTGEPMNLQVRGGKPVVQPFAIHFGVPAARWWDDIVHT